jgi:hypothetical protein
VRPIRYGIIDHIIDWLISKPWISIPLGVLIFGFWGFQLLHWFWGSLVH